MVSPGLTHSIPGSKMEQSVCKYSHRSVFARVDVLGSPLFSGCQVPRLLKMNLGYPALANPCSTRALRLAKLADWACLRKGATSRGWHHISIAEVYLQSSDVEEEIIHAQLVSG